MEHQSRIPVFFEVSSLEMASVLAKNHLSEALCEDRFLIVDTIKDKNQHKFLGQEMSNLLIYYDELTPLNNLLAIIPAVRSGCFVFFSYKKNDKKTKIAFYRSFFNPQLMASKQSNRIKKNKVCLQAHESTAATQLSVLSAVTKKCLDKRNGDIFFIQGVRGSGKSFLAGLIAQTIEKNGLSSVVTAPNKRAVSSVFAAYSGAKYLDFYKIKNKHLDYFLLVIDEISSIGSEQAFSLAKSRLDKGLYTICVGTQDGYEGDVNHLLLNKNNQDIQQKENMFVLDEERRFLYKQDVLSVFCQKAMQPWLFFSVNDFDVKEILSMFHVEHNCYVFSGDSLKSFVPEIFSLLYKLLKQAHYKTSPNDFWRFFNQPSVFSIKISGGQIISACQAYAEFLGEKSDDLNIRDVLNNSRRTKGLLTQQSLCGAYAGMDEGFLKRKILRISRIATSFSHRRKGFASELVDAIKSYAVSNGFDYLSASFAMIESHYAFWRNNGFIGVRLALEKNKKTGKKAALMLRATSHSRNISVEMEKIKGFFSWFVAFYSPSELAFSRKSNSSKNSECFTWNKNKVLSKKQLWQSLDSVLNGFRFVSWAIPEVVFWIDNAGQEKQWKKLREELKIISEIEEGKKKDEALKIALHPLKDWLEKN